MYCVYVGLMKLKTLDKNMFEAILTFHDKWLMVAAQ